LVIKNEKNMNDLLQFLIFSIRTVDGHRESADKIHRSLLAQRLEEREVEIDMEYGLLKKNRPKISSL